MEPSSLDILVTPQWLAENLSSPTLVILDATIVVPGAASTTRLAQHIPGALRFDIDNEFSDSRAPHPHTLPDPQQFSEQVQTLGINNDSLIVVYDDIGIFSAPRAWWMWRAMGHQQVFILNGGLPAWLSNGGATAIEHAAAKSRGDFQAHYEAGWFVDITTVEQAVSKKNKLVVDARNSDRFNSRIDEPRPGVRRGNIPGSCNLPFEQVLHNGRYKSSAELQQQFQLHWQNIGQPLIFSCGSGVTACIDAVAALLAGVNNVSVYDGSWCEWATVYPS